MSDTSQGPGWWQASDGKWYAPELYPAEWPRPDAAADVGAEPAPEVLPTAAMPVVEAVDEAIPLVANPGAVTSVVTPGVDVPSGWAPSVDTSPPPIADPTTVIASQAELRDTTKIQQALDAPAPPSWGAPAAPSPAPGPSAWQQPSPGAPQVPPLGGPAPAPPAWNPSTAPAAAWPGTVPAAPAAGAASADVPAGLLALLGGVALAASAFFDWAKVTGVDIRNGSVNGLTGSNGVGMLIAGGVAALGALLLFAKMRSTLVGLLIVLAGLAAVGLWIFSYWDLGDPMLERLSDSLTEAGRADIVPTLASSREPILWVALGGAAATTLAGFLALARRQ